MDKYCKRCLSKNVIDFEQLEYVTEDDIKIVITGFKCTKCDCVHALNSDGKLDFYEYYSTINKPAVDVVGKWSTNKSTVC